MKKIIAIAALTLLTVSAAFSQQRCKGIKKDGQQCKLTTKSPSGFCHHHDPKTPCCGFIKKDGTPCKMQIKAGETACYIHIKQVAAGKKVN